MVSRAVVGVHVVPESDSASAPVLLPDSVDPVYEPAATHEVFETQDTPARVALLATLGSGGEMSVQDAPDSVSARGRVRKDGVVPTRASTVVEPTAIQVVAAEHDTPATLTLYCGVGVRL